WDISRHECDGIRQRKMDIQRGDIGGSYAAAFHHGANRLGHLSIDVENIPLGQYERLPRSTFDVGKVVEEPAGCFRYPPCVGHDRTRNVHIASITSTTARARNDNPRSNTVRTDG